MAFSIPIHFVGKPVRSLQTMLRMISQYAEEIPTVIPDGIYADSTAACVIALQKRHGLPMTGETDFHTWTVIVKEYRRAVLEIGPAESIHPILQPKEAIRAQEVNQNLFMIHGMLLAIREYFPSMPLVQCNNLHDAASVAAVRWLQVRAGLPATGQLNRSTWKCLARLYRMVIGSGSRIQ